MQSEAKAKALEQFTDYFVKNYPGPDTVIFNPNWHAPKIFAAAYSAISAALSDKQAVEVKTSPSTVPVYLDNATKQKLRAALRFSASRSVMSSNDERRILAAFDNAPLPALVDVPAVEPVGYTTQWSLDEVRAGRLGTIAPADTMRPENEIPLYASPPLSREGEGSAEVDGLTKALTAAYEEFNRIACEFVTETRSTSDVLDRCHVFANRGASSVRAALAATRSGSATAATGAGGDNA